MEQPAPPTKSLETVLQRLTNLLETTGSSLARDKDPDYGHKVRVAIRRTRVALRAQHCLIEHESASLLSEDLRWFSNLVGEARDLVLFRQFAASTFSVAEKKILVPVIDRQQIRALNQVRKSMRSSRFQELSAKLKKITKLAVALPEDAAQRKIALYARKLLKKLLKQGAIIDNNSKPEKIHDFRRQLKKFRYTLELLKKQDITIKWMPDLLIPVKSFQDWLGHYQDRCVQYDLLKKLETIDSLSQEEHLIFKKTAHHLRSQRDQLTDNFPKLFNTFQKQVLEMAVNHHLKALYRIY